MAHTISPEGTVTLSGVGPVNVTGLTVAAAQQKIRSRLGKHYSGSSLRLTLGSTRSIMVNIMGEVRTPGTYHLSPFATAFHALYTAGGIGELGTLRNIKVFRGGRLVTVIDIYEYILNGRLAGNIRLQDEDVIQVGPYECLVGITGNVKRPMFYEMRKNESVGTLLKYAGGFTGDAFKKSVRLVRQTGDRYTVHNVDEFEMNTFKVDDGDAISVDGIINRYENMVEIKGAVFRPGMYQVGGEVNSVRTLLEASEGLKEDAFTGHAVMHRMRKDRTLEVIQVDVDGILEGKVADIPLKPNDVLFIPTRQDLMEEQTITIHGEVNYPGVYKYAANETIEDFILQAGGLKEAASTSKVDVARRVINPGATTNDSIIAHTFSFSLKEGFIIDGEPGFTLQPFDEVYVRRSPGYSKQQNVKIEGEVMFAGTYTLETNNMRVSELLRKAGGVNERAYLRGARLERKYDEVERQRAIKVLRDAQEQAELNLQEQIAKTGNANIANLKQTQQLRKYEVGETYPVGIDLEEAVRNPGSDEDIVLREGDRIVVPTYTGTVKVNGEVLYPNTVVYEEGKGASYYINQAGGFSTKAKKRQAYIIYMNGKVAKVSHNAKPQPGCEIVVPAKAVNKTTLAETLSIATSVGSFAAIIATIANIIK
jgi:protein involved in polysaccharide export with SLBB domain